MSQYTLRLDAGRQTAAPEETASPASERARPGPEPARRRPRNADAALSVAAVNRLARELIEGSIPPLWVAGELTGWKSSAAGACYFTLRDADAQLRCVMFHSDARRLPTTPEEGMQVRVLGGLSIYEKRGTFQLIARRLEAAGGDGLWRLAFERLRARLDAEGLLDPARKRRLPRCPATIGVVTSAAGAALHDILRVLERRAPWTRVVFVPARVQGDGAAAEISAAIQRVARAGGVDVLIVGRGGGSVEDLWAFNEESVARAIAASRVPVISAVGHETDVSIADLVADVRAPTPSAAAELAVLDADALRRQLGAVQDSLRGSLRAQLELRRTRLERGRDRLEAAARALVQQRRQRLAMCAGRLDALSPLAALARGYAVPLAPDGRVLRRLADFLPQMRFGLRVADGTVPCRVAAPAPPDADS